MACELYLSQVEGGREGGGCKAGALASAWSCSLHKRVASPVHTTPLPGLPEADGMVP